MIPIEISINPFAEYLEATESRKKQILKEQMIPDPVRIPYYQLARARMKTSILNSGDHSVIQRGINDLKAKKTIKKWQISDKENSSIALNRFKELILPKQILENELELISTKSKHFTLFGVRIKISPNLIFRINIDGVNHIGACKIHISKGKPFSNKQSKIVATLLYQFLSNHVAEEDDYVNPELCFCLDPFAGTTINSYSKITVDMKIIKQLCSEIPKKWDIVVQEQNFAA